MRDQLTDVCGIKGLVYLSPPLSPHSMRVVLRSQKQRDASGVNANGQRARVTIQPIEVRTISALSRF